jgi:hypothetical protein
MSWARPIFNSGLWGSANRAVVSTWMRGSAMAQDNEETFAWARREMRGQKVWSVGLVFLTNATLISGANPHRWRYTTVAAYPDNPDGAAGAVLPSELRRSYTKAYNLREWHNTALYVDNMPVNAPVVTVGPVGSRWAAGVWPTAELYALVNLYVTRDRAGKPFPFFDRPNPIRCS